MVECKRADEIQAMFVSDDKVLADRKQFVHNLGELLSQTRESIVGAELDDNEIVTVTYKNDHTIKVNVAVDSYLAIIRDVTKHL